MIKTGRASSRVYIPWVGTVRADRPTRTINGRLWSGLSVSSTSLRCIKRLVVEAFS